MIRRLARLGIGAFAFVCAAALGPVPFIGTAAAHAVPTYYVSPSGMNASGHGTAKAPFKTINYALSQAPSGSTVIVDPGTYHEMVVITKTVNLQGGGSTASQVVIDAKGLKNGIYIHGAGAKGTAIRQLTVQHALYEGILAEATSYLVIDRNSVTQNALISPKPEDIVYEAVHINGVTHSTISTNSVRDNHDGGIYLTNEFGDTTNNSVLNNTVAGNAIDCAITLATHAPGGAGVSNNLIQGNSVYNNGAAGVGLFIPVPGGHNANNRVLYNYVINNGMPGVSMFTHAPNDDMTGNKVYGNTLRNNGAAIGLLAGVAVIGDVDYISWDTFRDNHIGDEDYGFFLQHTSHLAVDNNQITAKKQAIVTLP